ncbi:PREDICTED: uncharacterized protein LOC105134771 isoform X3 [Populus euphratica]|uniref:Uncharacterized protein LOC105134771 isoform X3 n=1 Tax=Populus euphratica TaxID=75702 RepID=A0AAJ6Y0H9_POPEU|nr:PREDICTED: uncharacterized protein LOC105134771 isoform X3 [Populus euphratica]
MDSVVYLMCCDEVSLFSRWWIKHLMMAKDTRMLPKRIVTGRGNHLPLSIARSKDSRTYLKKKKQQVKMRFSSQIMISPLSGEWTDMVGFSLLLEHWLPLSN